MDLERYMIPVEESADIDDLKTTAITGAIILAPLAIAAIIQSIKEKKKKKIAKYKSEEERRLKDKEYQKVIEINERIKKEYSEIWEIEKKNREKTVKDITKLIEQMGKRYNKSFPAGLGFGDDNEDDYITYNDFLHNPLPKESPLKAVTPDCWYCDGWEIDNVMRYDITIWNEIENNNLINVRNYEECSDYYSALEKMYKLALSSFCKNPYVYTIGCGGDWDDGTYYAALKPSDKILNIAYSMGYTKWPIPNKS